MAIPTAADLHGPLATEIHSYLDTATASAEERIRLFRLAWVPAVVPLPLLEQE